LLVGDQGLVIRSLGPGHCEFCFSAYRPGRFDDVLTARRDQRRLQGFDVVRKAFTIRIHALIESQVPAADS
jgi:hypothetical protein